MKRLLCGLTAALAMPLAQAAEYDIQVENVTRGIYFTPLLVAAHAPDVQLFTPGEAASASLQAMAEGGDISALEADLAATGATISANPAGGLLVPGATTSTTLNTDNATANTRLSVVAMLLPTNDGFVGLNGLPLPTEPGTYHYDVAGWDAGSEGNDEIRGSGVPGEAGFPVPPPLDPVVGTNGTGTGAAAEGYVHVHRGNLGDTQSDGGVSDIDSTLHRWLNPVARVTITVQ